MLLDSKRTIPITRLAAICLLAAAALAPFAQAQYRSSSTNKKTSPRALAVVQVLPKGAPRLFPVTIFLDGKFYDARFYYAKPVPLALYDETVYEALSDGMPVGEFTVHTAREVSDSGVWWGEGDWKPVSSEESASKNEKAKPITVKGDKDEDRPTLKKPGSSTDDKKADTSGTNEKSQPTIKPDDDNERPVLRKPSQGTTDTQVKITTADLSPKAPPEDPNRPVLRRQQPVQQKEEPETITAPKTGIPGAKYLVAISDPEPMNNRPYHYMWDESERAKWTEQMKKMGMEAARKFVNSGETRAQLLPTAKFAEVQVSAFDLDYSNSPYIVFTGRIDPTLTPPPATKKASAAQTAPPQLATFYVTLVVRLNMQGELNRLLTVVTDSGHLDLHPRLDLIDAVDADGDNRAELLFRKTADTGSTYVLYRMTPFQMTQIFEGGSGN